MARNENIYFCFHILYAKCAFCRQRCAAGRLSSWLLAHSTCQVRRSRCLLPGNPCQTHWWMRECGFCHEGARRACAGRQTGAAAAPQCVATFSSSEGKKITSETFSEQRVNIFQMCKYKSSCLTSCYIIS